MHHLIKVLFLFLPILCAAQPEQVDGRLVPVTIAKILFDGDGARVWINGRVRKVRFGNTNSPEFKAWTTTKVQPYAKQSRDSMRALLHVGDTILLDTLPFGKRKMSYDRLVVDAYLKPNSTYPIPRLISYYSISRGWSWYQPSPKDRRINPPVGFTLVGPASVDEVLATAQQFAIDNQIGLFDRQLYPKALAPWYWLRKYHRLRVPIHK